MLSQLRPNMDPLKSDIPYFSLKGWSRFSTMRRPRELLLSGMVVLLDTTKRPSIANAKLTCPTHVLTSTLLGNKTFLIGLSDDFHFERGDFLNFGILGGRVTHLICTRTSPYARRKNYYSRTVQFHCHTSILRSQYRRTESRNRPRSAQHPCGWENKRFLLF